MIMFDDNNAWMGGKGNLTLGNGGKGDGKENATYSYAKDDCWINVPLQYVPAMCLTQAGTFTRTSAGLYYVALAAAGTTGIIVVPLNFLFRTFAGGGQNPTNPHGFMVKDLILGYVIATADETSVGVTFATNLDANNAVRAAVTAPFGAVTYENPLGTVAATLPVAQQANPYMCRAVPAAPAFVSADNTDAYAEISVVNPGTSVFRLTHLSFHCAMALY